MQRRLLSALIAVFVVACQSQGPAGQQGAGGERGAQGEPGQKGDSGASVIATPVGASDDRCPGGAGGIEFVIGSQTSVICNGVAGPQGARGSTGLNWLGEWSSLVSYSPTDAISYNGSSYIALVSSQGTPPPSAEWSLLASKGEPGSKGDKGDEGAPGDKGEAGISGEIGMTPRGEWSPSTSYVPRDAVTFGGSSYVATLASLAVPPPSDGWMLLAERGVAGLPGEKGEKGEIGGAGLQGEKGDKGLQGEKGDKGDKGLQGDKGDTGATGAAGTTGQAVTSSYSTSSLTMAAGGAYQLIPGLQQTITVPSNARLMISTYGGIQTTSTSTSGFSKMDIGIVIDGAALSAGGFQRVVAANTAGVSSPGMVANWSMTTSANIAAGSHTVGVVALGAGAGGSSATVASDASGDLQAGLVVTIVKL